MPPQLQIFYAFPIEIEKPIRLSINVFISIKLTHPWNIAFTYVYYYSQSPLITQNLLREDQFKVFFCKTYLTYACRPSFHNPIVKLSLQMNARFKQQWSIHLEIFKSHKLFISLEPRFPQHLNSRILFNRWVSFSTKSTNLQIQHELISSYFIHSRVVKYLAFPLVACSKIK